MTSLNPVHKIGDQLIEATLLHRDVSRKQARALALEALGRGGDPAGRAADRRLPASVLGWDAAARDDRDGADQRSEAADRGRADDCARRHDAGTDPGPDAHAAGGARDGDHHDHARPRSRGRGRRRGGRHVRGPRRGASARQQHLRAADASLHLGAARLAAASRDGRRAADADPRPASVTAPASRRLPFQPAVRVRLRSLPHGAPAARPDGVGPVAQPGVLPRRGDAS